MDLGSSFIFLIIFGIFGFFFSKIAGVNPYRIFSDLTAALLIISMIIIVFPTVINPEHAIDTIPEFIEFFGAALPGVIIGDAAGSIVAGIAS